MKHEALLKVQTPEEVTEYIEKGIQIDDKHVYFIPVLHDDEWDYLVGMKIKIYDLEILYSQDEYESVLIDFKSGTQIGSVYSLRPNSEKDLVDIIETLVDSLESIIANLLIPAFRNANVSQEMLQKKPATFVFNTDDTERIVKFAKKHGLIMGYDND